MEHPEPERRSPDDVRAREQRQTWVERYLGDGWQEVEPGIYRFVGPTQPLGVDPESLEPDEPPSDELGGALDPAHRSPEPSSRRFGRLRHGR